jgi:hypothetical protein
VTIAFVPHAAAAPVTCHCCADCAVAEGAVHQTLSTSLCSAMCAVLRVLFPESLLHMMS